MYTETQLHGTSFAMAIILFVAAGLCTLRLLMTTHAGYAIFGPILFVIALGALMHAFFIPSRKAFYTSQVTSVIVMVLTVLLSL